MLQTQRHGLYKPEIGDDILDSIDKISNNFEVLDQKIDENAVDLTIFLQEGTQYTRNKKIWNNTPTIGGYAGWVNIRDGYYAPTWQEQTQYSVGDLTMPDINNGHYYQCIAGGTSTLSQPVFPTLANQIIDDIGGSTVWTANKLYEIDDIVIATSGVKTNYYRCIKTGVSGLVEPVWGNEGSTVNDDNVIWQVYKTVQWKEVGISCEFRPFGKIE